MPEKCTECGKFLSMERDNNIWAYTPYGSYGDTQPPDEEFICGRCWSKQTPKQLELLKRISYSGPTRLQAPDDQEE